MTGNLPPNYYCSTDSMLKHSHPPPIDLSHVEIPRSSLISSEKTAKIFPISPRHGRSCRVSITLPENGELADQHVRIVVPAKWYDKSERLDGSSNSRLLPNEKFITTAKAPCLVQDKLPAPGSEEFALVNTFYHSARFISLLKSFGLPADFRATILVNLDARWNSAFAQTTGRYIALQSCSTELSAHSRKKIVPRACPPHDATVIAHELMHGVLRSTFEKRNIALVRRHASFLVEGWKEGLCDYFAYAYTGTPLIGAAFDSRHSLARPVRNISRPSRKSPHQGCHTLGHLFAYELLQAEQESGVSSLEFSQCVFDALRILSRTKQKSFEIFSFFAKALHDSITQKSLVLHAPLLKRAQAFERRLHN